jgi:hypothetical protein
MTFLVGVLKSASSIKMRIAAPLLFCVLCPPKSVKLETSELNTGETPYVRNLKG